MVDLIPGAMLPGPARVKAAEECIANGIEVTAKDPRVQKLLGRYEGK